LRVNKPFEGKVAQTEKKGSSSEKGDETQETAAASTA
jgi:hypothetical protein